MIKLGIFLLAAPGAQALSHWVVGRLTVSAIVVSVPTGSFGIRSYVDQVSNFGTENPQPAHPPINATLPSLSWGGIYANI
jgi:hypothetical protein